MKKKAVKKSAGKSIAKVEKSLAKTENKISQDSWAIAESVMFAGDLSKLTAEQKVKLYRDLCHGLKLNPMTKPFDLIKIKSFGKEKEILYANRNCTDQLRTVHNVNIQVVEKKMIPEQGIYIVAVRAIMPNGRTDESTGVVDIHNLKGEALGNALLKCETKAKRRLTLSILGLSLLDESEVESIPLASKEPVAEILIEGQPVQEKKPDIPPVDKQIMSLPANIKDALKDLIDRKVIRNSEAREICQANQFDPVAIEAKLEEIKLNENNK